MNPSAQKYQVRPCIVCGFPLSDQHHIHSEVLGRSSNFTIILCPNHHRCAHILQNMMNDITPFAEINDFSSQYFDPVFNEKALLPLMSVSDCFYDIKYKDFSKMTDQDIYSLVERELLKISSILSEMEQDSVFTQQRKQVSVSTSFLKH